MCPELNQPKGKRPADGEKGAGNQVNGLCTLETLVAASLLRSLTHPLFWKAEADRQLPSRFLLQTLASCLLWTALAGSQDGNQGSQCGMQVNVCVLQNIRLKVELQSSLKSHMDQEPRSPDGFPNYLGHLLLPSQVHQEWAECKAEQSGFNWDGDVVGVTDPLHPNSGPRTHVLGARLKNLSLPRS